MRQHTVRVHLHHDHRDSLVADPDDPGTSLSLSGLLIGRGSLWGVGLSLTWLIRLVGRWRGWSLSLRAARHRGPQVHLRHRQAHYNRCEEVDHQQFTRLTQRATAGHFLESQMPWRETINKVRWQPGSVETVFFMWNKQHLLSNSSDFQGS